MARNVNSGGDPDSRPAVAGRRRSTAAYAIASYATNVGVATLGLANVLIVSRALGPAGRGEVAFMMTIASMTTFAAGFGVQTANAYFGGSAEQLRRRLASNSVVIAVVFGALGTGAVTLLIHIVPAAGGHVDSGTRWIALASPPIAILGTYLTVLVQSDYRFGITNLTWLLPPATNVIANGVMHTLGVLTVRTAITTWVAGQALGMIVLLWYTAYRLSGFSRPDVGLARRMVGFGVKTHAGQIGMVANYRLDQWLLGAISGNRELGLYSVAVSWAEILFFLPTVIANVQRPDLVRSSREEAGRNAAAALRLALLLILLSGAAIIAAAPFLCTTIFGDAFAGSVPDLRILALGALGVALTKQLGNAMMSQGKPLRETAAIVVAFLVTALADVLLIPKYGDVGASLASTVSYSTGGLIMAAIFVRTFAQRPADLVPRMRDARWLWTQARGRLGGRSRTSV